jgi:hypothetical protein
LRSVSSFCSRELDLAAPAAHARRRRHPRISDERDRLDGMMSGRGGAIARMSDATGGPLQVTNR